MNYQISKTVRFGLTLKNSEKKHATHLFLKELVDISEDRIKKEVTKDVKNQAEVLFFKKVVDTIKLIESYIELWDKCFYRTDHIQLTKEYYKVLAKKACFDWFWIDKRGMKQPMASIISFNSLQSKDGIDRKNLIVNFWKGNILKSKKAIENAHKLTNDIINAIEENKSHKEINRVNHRKICISLIHLMHDTLMPLCNGSIFFGDISKLDINESSNNDLIEFASSVQQEERNYLLSKINEIKQYFEDNGGNVPFARATLNRHTANQKPDRYDEEIKNFVKELGLKDLVNKWKNKTVEEIKTHFEFEDKNKINEIKNSYVLSIVEKIQLFKYKTIPASVRYLLADYFVEQRLSTKEEALNIFEEIGKPQNIGFDYTQLKDKEDFTLKKYPLKQAFDYAWENLARLDQNPIANQFPVEECKQFLKEIFNVETDNLNFKTYALLLALKEKTTAFDKKGEGAAKNKLEIVEEIKGIFEQINRLLNEDIINLNKKLNIEYDDKKRKKIEYKIKGLKKGLNSSIPTMLKWIDLTEDEQENDKHKNLKRDYQKAKGDLGLIRGGQKSSINTYFYLTNKVFKKLAQDFGKKFADLREKLLEKNDVNKIKYLSYIVKDQQGYQYTLLKPLEDKNEDAEELKSEPDGDFTLFEIKSLTSKTLNKFIKNKGAYKEFHSAEFEHKKIKEDWKTYKNDSEFINKLKKCLTSSDMAKDQNWKDFGWQLDKCKKYEDIEKEIDQKSYQLVEIKLSKTTIEKWVKENNYFLLPIVNQDITAEKSKVNTNQFTKDWQHIFEKNTSHRLHPEFNIAYRQPTKDYAKEGEKRYSRFQLTGQFMYEYIPQNQVYLSRKEQIALFNNKDEQINQVSQFNNQIAKNLNAEDFYIIGIDRGITQLATLCVLDKNGVIQGDFEIFTREFDYTNNQWKHSKLKENRNILDISNLKVETTVKGEKVLVDLSEVKTYLRDENGEPIRENGEIQKKDNQQKIKLKQLAYTRKLQYKMQFEPERVLDFIKLLNKKEEIPNLLASTQLISKYKEGTAYTDIDIEQFWDMLQKFQSIVDKFGDIETAKKTMEFRQFTELDASYELKNGVVANMVGVVKFIMEKYNYKTYIALEDLTFALGQSIDGINGERLRSTKEDKEVDFKEQENSTLAGLGTYHFFEMQLLKKLSKIQIGNEIKHFVPAFRSTENYEKIVRKDKKDKQIVNYPFGIVSFVNPFGTSVSCPNCKNQNRNNRIKAENDRILCKLNKDKTKGNCGFDTANFDENKLRTENKGKNFKYISSGDANAAYNIAKKLLEVKLVEIKNNNK